MKIGILLKQTPDTETKIKIKPDASGIEEADIKWVISTYDEYAVEEALRLKEKVPGSEVVVLSAGPKRSVEAIRQAMAMGVDRGIHINTEGLALDSYLTSLVLAKAASTEGFDVLLGGKQAIDDDNVQVAFGVAQILGWPCVWPVEYLEASADGKTIVVHRPVAGGVKEILEVGLPGVLCCDKGEHEPRYASLPGIMKAKTKPLQEIAAKDFVGTATPLVSWSGFSLPPERKAGQILKGDDPGKLCDELIRLLREEAKVI